MAYYVEIPKKATKSLPGNGAIRCRPGIYRVCCLIAQSMKVIAIPVSGITVVLVVFVNTITRYFIHIKEGWKWLNLVEDPAPRRNHSKLLLRSRKLQ